MFLYLQLEQHRAASTAHLHTFEIAHVASMGWKRPRVSIIRELAQAGRHSHPCCPMMEKERNLRILLWIVKLAMLAVMPGE